MEYDRIIIGAGAAGLYAAATAENKVDGLIIDHSHYPGLKLLLSGSGQCNITHGGSIKNFLGCYGDNGKRIRSILYSANNMMLMDFIESLGVPLMERPDGKVFPKSLKASDVLNALLRKAEENGFRLQLDENVKNIERIEGKYVVSTDKGTYSSPVLIVAAGGKSYPRTGSDGSVHNIITSMGMGVTELNPALVPVFVHGYSYREGTGISFKNSHISIYDGDSLAADNTDDLLLTHKGFSGPAIINISRYVKAGMTMRINYVNPLSSVECSQMIKKTYQQEKKQISTYISKLFRLPAAFTDLLLKELEIDGNLKARTLSGDDIHALSEGLSDHSYDISGVGSFAEAMVTKGGVSLEEIDLKTMESKKYPGLFFAGEILDIDGDTGGYNLQFAFSSAKAINRALK